MKSNLVISPVGDSSKHYSWIQDRDSADFDLFLIYFGDEGDWAQSDAKYYLRRKGFKYQHLYHVSKLFEKELRSYDRIWCPDDDIYLETQDTLFPQTFHTPTMSVKSESNTMFPGVGRSK